MSSANERCETVPEGEAVLNSNWTFWYHRRRGDKKNVDYNELTKPISSFGSVEGFWQVYDHIVRPNEFKVTTDYHLFKEGVKPTWEDPMNRAGGKWMVRLKKGLASRYWEELLIAMIGEQFEVGQEICGAVVSVRNSEDIISIWNKSSENKDATNKIRDQMRRILKLPQFISIEYKKHVDAKADGSSFRNPSMVWRASNRDTSTENGSGNSNINKGGDNFRDNRNKQNNNRNTGRDGGFGNNKREGGGSFKQSAPSTSTGDPARDAAAAKGRAEQREQGGSGNAWGKPMPHVRSDSGGNSGRERGEGGHYHSTVHAPGPSRPTLGGGEKKENSWIRGGLMKKEG